MKLIFSQAITLTSAQPLKVTLGEDTQVLDEVVVTALGIKRATKALSYNVQEVKGDELTTVKSANFMNSLAGKVAGVNINASSSGVGGATRVVMRGTKSISSDNNALYVIDGVPIFNTNKGDTNGQYSAQPRGEGISDINPEDIESMSVLSGPAAAALYGSNAASGVILITTKKGKEGKARIIISNNSTFSNPFIMPEFQNSYINRAGSFASWGDKASSLFGTYEPKDFFNTGTNIQNNVSLSVGNEKNQTYLSVGTTNATGIIQNSKYDRYNFTFRNTTKFLKDKMTLDVGFSYIIQEDLNLMAQGEYFNPLPDMNSPHGLRFTRYINDPKNPNSISNNDVYFTYQDSQGRIWVGLLGGGLNLISEENGAITFIHKYNGLKQYPAYGLYMEVRTMTEDEDGRIWVGTMDGLMSFDGHFTAPEQIQFETYRQVSENSNVADNDIYVLYKDTDSQIWVSVFGGGLNKLVRYDKEKREPIFKSYGIREGMNNDVVKSIVEDKNGNLWFTTEIGLSCFNKATEQFRNYDKYDGFLNVELEEGSALRTLNGDLWIGTRQGILTFSPDKLETLHTNYDTRIVDFKVSNRDLRSFRECPILKESITYAKAIELNYNQSMFTIEFAALNFYNQNRVSYRYILEGYEKEWHYNGKNRIASYTNVPPGDYTFRVETVDEANPELVSNCTLAITILPPWWLSWWATLIYVILGLAALYFSLRLAFFMLKMKNDIYIEQKVSEMKIKFFTNISHELRTPLTLIKGPIQELREREKLSPKGLQYVDLMEKNTNQMLQLVNQILDFRKIQNGKMRLHVSLIDFNEMIASFQKEFRVLSEENEISFTFQLPDEPIMVWADKEKMSIVIRNIISNAFKFTHSGGSIYITTGLTDDGKRCYVRVEDNGVGIPQNKLTEIFERFSQGENAKNSYYQGTGIGLALSKEIVNLHHGQIRAESPEGQGAVFIVELLMDKEHYRPSEVDFYVGDTETAPVSVEQDPVANAISEDGTEEEPEIDASLPTLLLVEDNKDLCQLIKLQLEDKFNIHIANNGVEGLKKVHLYHPDIVVTDQMMPEMDGLEMLQSIRKDFQISHIPVIILTAKNDEGAKTKAITLGANAYITKPFSKEYLLARIDQLLAERKLFRERIRQQMENQTTTEEDSYEQFLVKKDVQFLEKIHQVIEENMDDSDFNIDTIASGIGLSRSAFFKKLKSLTGLAPVDLVKEIRLNKSIELIKNTDLSVSEIAFAVGFKDSGYYSKCFRKKYNQSPREYMNEWRKGER